MKESIINSLKVVTLFFSLFFVFSSIISADFDAGHIMTGEFNQSGTDLQYYKHSSVGQYGLTGAVDNAVTQWNNASSEIDISSTTSTECNGCIPVYVGEYVLESGAWGGTDYWVPGWFGTWNQVTNYDVIYDDGNFDMARVRLDMGHMNDDSFTQSQRYHNAGHELGHALSLNHFENAPAHTGNHWMKSGQISLTSPTSTDISHLTQKWGY